MRPVAFRLKIQGRAGTMREFFKGKGRKGGEWVGLVWAE